MKPTMRRYRNEDDYWAIRRFLRDTLQANDGVMHSWHVARFDYWRWHVSVSCELGPIENHVFMWEDEQERLVAVLNPEGPGQAYLHIHPAARTRALEEEMIQIAEKHLSAKRSDGVMRVVLWVNENDTLRQDIVANRGFEKHELARTQDHRRSLLNNLPSETSIEAFQLRSQGDEREWPKRSLASWRAFHPGEDESARDSDDSWFQRFQQCPLYRRDLDIVAVDQKDEYAAFCTCWFDDFTRSGVFEPVGVDPTYQRQGLGRAVMAEALSRLQQLGATTAYVGSEDPNACAFYEAIGFPVVDRYAAWIKVLSS